MLFVISFYCSFVSLLFAQRDLILKLFLLITFMEWKCSFLCLGEQGHKAYKKFQMIGESKNTRFAKLVRILSSFSCLSGAKQGVIWLWHLTFDYLNIEMQIVFLLRLADYLEMQIAFPKLFEIRNSKNGTFVKIHPQDPLANEELGKWRTEAKSVILSKVVNCNQLFRDFRGLGVN